MPTKNQTNKANKPATETAKPETVEASNPKKQAEARHGFKPTYAGSPLLRKSNPSKLSPVDLEFIPGSFTGRDADAVRDFKSQFAGKQFRRNEIDAGNLKRLLNAHDGGEAFLTYVSGGTIVTIDGRKHVAGSDAIFKLTSRGTSY